MLKSIASTAIGILVAQTLMAVLLRYLPRLRRGWLQHWYYPGGRLMRLSCWLRHPVSRAERAEAAFSTGFSWPDPDGWGGSAPTGERNP